MEIPAGSRLNINFHNVNIGPRDTFTITIYWHKHSNQKKDTDIAIKRRTISGKILNGFESYGPFDDKTVCLFVMNLENSDKSSYHIGINAKQMLLPLGICGNINLL